MLTFQVQCFNTDQGWLTEDEGYDPYSFVTFECPNPDVAKTFVEAFNRIDASTWTDAHNILSDDIQVVDGPANDDDWIFTWDDIQADKHLCQEMFACNLK